MMTDFYSTPENHGLETIGEVDFASGYEFDKTVVWRRKADGMFLWAEDSGCSCPTPFESMRLDELAPLPSLAEFQAHLLGRNGAATWNPDRSAGIAELVERLHAAGLR